MTYIYLMFVPGSAGNFFSRCLSLASDRCFGLIPAQSDRISFSVEEKFAIYQYPDMPSSRNWHEFERQLVPYYHQFDHWSIPADGCSIWLQHPSYALVAKDPGGPDNPKFQFYIDPSQRFEWVVLNALYKNSYLDSSWLEDGERMLHDDQFIKIDINDLVDSADRLLAAVEQVCEISDIKVDDFSKSKIVELWQQWKKTTLPESQFDSYKRRIGFRL